MESITLKGFDALTREQKNTLLLGCKLIIEAGDNTSCKKLLDKTLSNEKGVSILRDIIVAQDAKAETEAEAIATNDIKEATSSPTGKKEQLSIVRASAFAVQVCNEDGVFMLGQTPLTDNMHRLIAGKKLSDPLNFVMMDLETGETLQMTDYSSLAEEDKSRFTEVPTFLLGTKTVNVVQSHYMDQLIPMDITEGSGLLRARYAISIGRHSKFKFILMRKKSIIKALNTLEHPLWNKKVLDKVEKGEIENIGHLALAMLESLYDNSVNLQGINEKKILDCIELVNGISKDCLTDDEITTYVGLAGLKANATVAEKSTYISKMIKEIAWSISRLEIFGKRTSNKELCEACDRMIAIAQS